MKRAIALLIVCIFLTSCATGQDQNASGDEIALLEEQIAELESADIMLVSSEI